jgi:hypothetical protein
LHRPEATGATCSTCEAGWTGTKACPYERYADVPGTGIFHIEARACLSRSYDRLTREVAL